MPLILLGGSNRLDTIERAIEDGFSFVAMGRPLLREPDLIDKMQKGSSASWCRRRSPRRGGGRRRPLPASPSLSGRRFNR